VVSAEDLYGRNLGFLDRSRYSLIQVAVSLVNMSISNINI
jgi:hypothetical protein